MINFKKIEDAKRLKTILSDEEISSGLVHVKINWEKNFDFKNVFSYLINDDDKEVGLVLLLNVSQFFKDDIVHMVDFGIKKRLRGKKALAISKDILRDFFALYPGSRMFATIKVTNRKSLIFALWNGFNIINHDHINYYMELQDDGRFS